MEGHSKLLLTILFIYNFLLVLENTNTNRKLALQLVFTFIALSLLFGHQEELPVCKKLKCWHCLSGARFRCFAYGPADATATL